MDDDVQFIDAEQELRSPQGTTFKEIVMGHLTKISNICTKEFREGYWEERPVKIGESVFIIKNYKEDTRDAYVNAVDFLHDILLPRFNKDCIDKIEIINNKLKKEKEDIKDKNKWRDKRLELRREIFIELNKLLKHLKYLEAEAIM